MRIVPLVIMSRYVERPRRRRPSPRDACIPCGINARLGLAHLELYKLLFTKRRAGIDGVLVRQR
jgi:hypothetical protein